MQKICIVIPCYNEDKRLDTTAFIEYFSNNKNKYVCFVNDGSSDNTLTVLELLKKEIGSNCSIIDLKTNGGKAEAVRQGFLQNIDNDYDYIGFFDADLSTPISELDYFININMGELKHDIIMGSRLSRMGAKIKRKTRRHYMGRVFSTFASGVLDLQVYDTQCGAKLFSKKFYNTIFEEKFISNWLFDIELIYRSLNIYGRDYVINSVLEIPLNSWEDIDGSKLKPFDFIKAPIDLIRIKNHYKKSCL